MTTSTFLPIKRSLENTKVSTSYAENVFDVPAAFSTTNQYTNLYLAFKISNNYPAKSLGISPDPAKARYSSINS